MRLVAAATIAGTQCRMLDSQIMSFCITGVCHRGFTCIYMHALVLTVWCLPFQSQSPLG